MFVTLLLFCEVTDPLELWNKQWELLSDDIERRQRRLFHDVNLKLIEDQLKNYALFEIEKIMNRNNTSLKKFPELPFPDMSFRVIIENRLIREELNYEHDTLNDDFLNLFDGLNAEQKLIFDAITNAVEANSGGFFFVYGSGGTGKTYLWNTLISNLRSKGRIVLAVASSGIASLLLPGGRIAHSRFKIPIYPDENSCCNISQQTDLAGLIRKADLIVWDEAPMNHRNVFEAVDRTLKDILRSTVEGSEEKVFGGKTFVLGGDFKQTLPVVPHGSREDIVGSSISKSLLWKHCQVFVLTINMRLRDENMDDETIEAMSQFSHWILQLGNGRLPAVSVNKGEEPTWIKIQDEFLIPPGENSMQEIVNATYPDLVNQFTDPNYLKDRCILVPTNDRVYDVNSCVLATIPGEVYTFSSVGSMSKMEDAIPNQDVLHPVEFLNSLYFSGMPSHELLLKVGVPIMLLRNLN